MLGVEAKFLYEIIKVIGLLVLVVVIDKIEYNTLYGSDDHEEKVEPKEDSDATIHK